MFLGSKITADGDYSHKIKRHLLLQRKAMTNLDSVLKSKDITLSTKACIVKAMVFPEVMYRCESWTIKKAEHRWIDPFKPWCWRTLENPLDYKEIKSVNPKGNQLWIFIGRTDAEAETPIIWNNGKTPIISNNGKRLWCWKRLRAEKGSNRGRDGWTASSTQWTWVWANSRKTVKDREAWHAAVHAVPENQTWLGYWTTVQCDRHSTGFLRMLFLVNCHSNHIT